MYLIEMGTSYAKEIDGKPQVYDGDTLEIASQLFRLAGAAVPPANTLCGFPGNPWYCGQEASFSLAYTVAEH